MFFLTSMLLTDEINFRTQTGATGLNWDVQGDYWSLITPRVVYVFLNCPIVLCICIEMLLLVFWPTVYIYFTFVFQGAIEKERLL